MASVAQFFKDGGVWMFPIAFVSLFAVAIFVERFYVLYITNQLDGHALFEKIRNFLKKGELLKAQKACDAHKDVVLAQVLKGGLMHADVGLEQVQNGLEEVGLERLPEIQKRAGVLAGLASLATLMGLLGTVMGLIEAFRVVAEAPMDQKSILLTKSISVAMNTTAFGLMVAIPCMLGHLFLSGVSKKIIDEIDAKGLKLENLLSSLPKDSFKNSNKR